MPQLRYFTFKINGETRLFQITNSDMQKMNVILIIYYISLSFCFFGVLTLKERKNNKIVPLNIFY
jgi:hypothetical protein